MQRTLIEELKPGEKVFIKGWIYEIRLLSKMAFILLRDSSGIVQCVAKDEKILKEISNISLESVVEITGQVKKANIKAEFSRKDVEIEISDLNVLVRAENLPIHVNEKTTTTELSKRLDYRFLDVRKPKVYAIFKVESTILQAYREFMVKGNAIECMFPSIISSSSEGGTELYKLKYFEKDAYLSQSCQLYKQMLACSMEKVFAVFTVWRAEKHNTTRHLNESRQLDFEMAFADEFAAMDVLARCIQYIIKKVISENGEELRILNVKLAVPKTKYMTFKEVSDLMKKNKISMGKDDLSPEVEKKLCEIYPDTIVFVHDWPISGKPFYIMPKGKELSCGFDAIYQGVEISSGGQRVHIPDLLAERIKAKGLNPKNFTDYIDSFRYGAPPHAGWGLGLERLTMLMLGLENIREAVLFPRDRERLTP